MLVKCSHCKKMLSLKNFDSHKCLLSMTAVKNVPVAHFIDTSCNDEKYMTGWGLDGILYTFEVTSRKPIPIIEYIRRKVTPPESDEEVTEP